MPSVSIIIPSLNSAQIARVVGALQRQTAQGQILEIIVVGRDERGLLPGGVTFLDTGRPVSAAAARNRGARAAAGEYLLFIDSDCVAEPDLVERLLEAYTRGQQVICGGIMVDRSDYWGLCDNLLVFSAFLDAAAPGPREFLPSLNFTLARELFLSTGGFDERFPGAAGEDLDFSLLLRRLGYTLWFEPSARVLHAHVRSSAGAIWRHLRAFGRAHIQVARRNPTLSRAGRLSQRHAIWLFGAALPLAILDVTRLFAASPALRGYYNAAAGMIWARTGWYWGVAEALLAQP